MGHTGCPEEETSFFRMHLWCSSEEDANSNSTIGECMPSGFEPGALRFETYYLNHGDVHPSGNNHTTTLGYLSDLLKCQSIKYSVSCY